MSYLSSDFFWCGNTCPPIRTVQRLSQMSDDFDWQPSDCNNLPQPIIGNDIHQTCRLPETPVQSSVFRVVHCPRGIQCGREKKIIFFWWTYGFLKNHRYVTCCTGTYPNSTVHENSQELLFVITIQQFKTILTSSRHLNHLNFIKMVTRVGDLSHHCLWKCGN